MVKVTIPSEKKAEIIEFIKVHPGIKLAELREKFKISKQQAAGYKSYVLRNPLKIIPKKTPAVSANPTTTPKQINPPKKPEGGANMAIEDKDLEKIQGMINKSVEETVLKQSENIAIRLRELSKQDEEGKAMETQTLEKEKRVEETAARVSKLTKQTEDLSKELGALTETVKKQTPKPSEKPREEKPKHEGLPAEPKKRIFGTMHATYEDFFNCDECIVGLKNIITKHGLGEVAQELCGDDIFCKEAVSELTKRGFKISEPKKKEEKPGENNKKEGEGGPKEEGTKEEGNPTKREVKELFR